MRDGSWERMPSLGEFAARRMEDQAAQDAMRRMEDDQRAAEDMRRQAEEAQRAADDAQQAFDTARHAGGARTMNDPEPDAMGNVRQASSGNAADKAKHDPMEMRSRYDRRSRNKAERSSAKLKALADLYSFGPGVDGAAYLAGLVTGAIFCRVIGKSDKSVDKRLDRDTRRALARARKIHDAAAREPGGDARLRDIEGQVRRGAREGVVRPSESEARHGAAPKAVSKASCEEATQVLDGKKSPGAATSDDDVDKFVDILSNAVDMQRRGSTFAEAQAYTMDSCETNGIDYDAVSKRSNEIIDRAHAIGRPDVVARSSDPSIMNMPRIGHTHETVHSADPRRGERTFGMVKNAKGRWVRKRADGTLGEEISSIGCRRLLDLDAFSERFNEWLDAYHYGNVEPRPTADAVDDIRAVLSDMAKPEGERQIFKKGYNLNDLRQVMFDVHRDQTDEGDDMSQLADALLMAGYEHPELLGPEGRELRERVLGADAGKRVDDVAHAVAVRSKYHRDAEANGYAIVDEPIVNDATLSAATEHALEASDPDNKGLDIDRLLDFVKLDDGDKPEGLSEADERAWESSRDVLHGMLTAIRNKVDSPQSPQSLAEAIGYHVSDDYVERVSARVHDGSLGADTPEQGGASATMTGTDAGGRRLADWSDGGRDAGAEAPEIGG